MKWTQVQKNNKIAFLGNERNVVNEKEITLYIGKADSKAFPVKFIELEETSINFYEQSCLCSRNILKTQMQASCN